MFLFYFYIDCEECYKILRTTMKIYQHQHQYKWMKKKMQTPASVQVDQEDDADSFDEN